MVLQVACPIANERLLGLLPIELINRPPKFWVKGCAIPVNIGQGHTYSLSISLRKYNNV